MNLKNLRKKANKLTAESNYLLRNIRSETAALTQATEHLKKVEIAREIVQNVAQLVQQKAHKRIAGVVTKCLQAVFDDPYTFRIIFERKRGKTDAKLVFRRGNVDIDPIMAAGGGVLDVAAFALRVSCLALAKPRKRRLLVLDEPFRFVSRNYIENVGHMLRGLSQELSIQFIIITHSDELKCGKVVELGR